jgi:hypothetical protein
LGLSRLGKTLLGSDLLAIFAGRRELFKGLCLEVAIGDDDLSVFSFFMACQLLYPGKKTFSPWRHSLSQA